jgi:hypothetical protein
MGKKFFDVWTVGHFIFGFLTTSTLVPSSPFLSAIITNTFHLINELIEKSESPEGKILESDVNHLGDIIFFFFGSLLGIIYGTKIFNDPKYYLSRYAILFLSILIYISEIGRELFPYTWTFFDSAYKPIW